MHVLPTAPSPTTTHLIVFEDPSMVRGIVRSMRESPLQWFLLSFSLFSHR